MKKIIVTLTLLVLLAANIFVATGCENKEDAIIAKEKVELLVSNIISQDRDAIKSLFASNKIEDIENFDESIDELINYFEGDFVLYFNRGLVTGMDKDDGIIHKYYDISCDITTTVRVYRMALKWYVKDTAVKGNVGIWQLFILKMEDDPHPEYSYWGDVGSPLFGIQIATLYWNEY